MKLVEYSVNSGQKNMDIDSELLEHSINNNYNEPVFRLYGWKPRCISLGRNQKKEFLSVDIDVVRRLTGGRALLHDNEITYSYISPISVIPNGESVIESYKYISGILIDFFKTIGIELEFGQNKKPSTHIDYCMLLSTGADVCFKGDKIIGSAQCRKNGYVLQHGSILYDYDKSFLESLFEEEIKGITSVKQILPGISKKDFVTKLSNYIISRT